MASISELNSTRTIGGSLDTLRGGIDRASLRAKAADKQPQLRPEPTTSEDQDVATKTGDSSTGTHQ